MGLLSLVLIVSFGQVVQRNFRSKRTADIYRESFLNYPANLAVPGVQIRNHEKIQQKSVNMPFGQNADVWRGNIGPLVVALSVNQPYPKWHDLNECYTGSGWTLNQTENVTAEDGTVYSRSSFVQDDRYGYLWFAAFDETGTNIRPATSGLVDRIKFFVFGRNERASSIDSDRIAIAQMFVESPGSLVLPFESELQTAFENFRKLSVEIGTQAVAAPSAAEPSPANSPRSHDSANKLVTLFV